MGSVRIGISNTLDDCQFTGIIEFLEAAHTWVKPDVIIDLECSSLANLESRARFLVEVIRIRNNSIQSVVPSSELNQDEDPSIGILIALYRTGGTS